MPKRILISAGHTNTPGKDRGVSANGIIEGVEATYLRDAIANRLIHRGHSVRRDGTDGINDPLTKALELIPGTDIAVEFHFNAAASPKATGIEVLSMPNRKADSQRIAAAIQAALGLQLRGEKGWKPDTSGQHHRLAFCRRGGLIVEVCFLTNPDDVRIYNAKRRELVEALVTAIGGDGGEVVPMPDPADDGRDFYKVQPGDSLWRIAGSFKTTVDALRRLNPTIGNPDAIKVGQYIQIR